MKERQASAGEVRHLPRLKHSFEADVFFSFFSRRELLQVRGCDVLTNLTAPPLHSKINTEEFKLANYQ